MDKSELERGIKGYPFFTTISSQRRRHMKLPQATPNFSKSDGHSSIRCCTPQDVSRVTQSITCDRDAVPGLQELGSLGASTNVINHTSV
jgi:hypothetical protein